MKKGDNKNLDKVHDWAKGFILKNRKGKQFHPYTYINFQFDYYGKQSDTI